MPVICEGSWATSASTRFARSSHVAQLSRSGRQVADLVGRMFNRLVAVIIGSVLMVVGVAMMVTIVMLPIGVVLGLLGVMIFVFGFFVPDARTGRRGDH